MTTESRPRETTSEASTLVSGPLLVGVTLDDRSDAAVRRATELSRLLRQPLDVLHAIEGGGFLTPAEERLAPRIRDLLVRRLGDELSDEARERLSVEEGKASARILARARDRSTGLILLGPHARERLVDLGGTARAVLTHAPCPVWNETDEVRPVRRVLVPVDLSEDSRGAAFWARELAAALDASVTLLHVFEPPVYTPPVPTGQPPAPGPSRPYVVLHAQEEMRESLERFGAELDGEGPPVETRFEVGPTVEGILDAQDDHDLVVVATHGRGAISSAVLGSVSHAVLRRADRAVVAVRHPSRHLPWEDERS